MEENKETIILYKNTFNKTETQPFKTFNEKNLELSIDGREIYTIKIKAYYIGPYSSETLDKTVSFENVKLLKDFIINDNSCSFCLCDLFKILEK